MDEDGAGLRANPRQAFAHPYPPTKIQFVPDPDGTRPDLLATAGDYLRIWRVGDEGVALEKLLNNVGAGGAGGDSGWVYKYRRAWRWRSC